LALRKILQFISLGLFSDFFWFLSHARQFLEQKRSEAELRKKARKQKTGRKVRRENFYCAKSNG